MYQTREEIPSKYKWDLTDLFKNEEAVNDKIAFIKANYPKLNDYKGKLGESSQTLESFFNLYEEIDKSLNKLIVYGSFNYHLNLKDQKNGAKLQSIEILANEVVSSIAWLNSELVSIGKEKLISFTKESKKLSEYAYFFDKLFVLEDHILDEKTEKALSFFELFNNSPADMYDKLASSDSKKAYATLKDGKTIEVTPGNFTAYLSELKDQDDRLSVLKARYQSFKDHANTFSGIYNQVVQRDVAHARAYNYKDSVTSYLKENNIPTEIYYNLVNTVKENADVFKKYIQLRKEYFKLDSYHSVDRFLEFAQSDKKYPFEEGLKIALAAAKNVNEEYYGYFKQVTTPGYIDVYETEGKTTGAYSWGFYDTHPYILLNYNDSLDSVFTLSHESGHSIHSLLSYKHQPYATHDYTIFVAEVASLFSENVLADYLKKTLTSKEEKLMLIQKAMDDIIATFVRQTLFADYELQIHQLAEKGQPITDEVLSNKMIELYDQYYGIDIKEEEVKQYVWAYIPHLFHTPFYVYQYATCFAVAAKLFEDYKLKGDVGINNFLNLLRSGGNDYPYQQVLNAGVDLCKKDVIMAVIHQANDLVQQLETLIK